jgi:hypothetical protein
MLGKEDYKSCKKEERRERTRHESSIHSLGAEMPCHKTGFGVSLEREA